MFLSEKGYNPQSPRLFYNKHESYLRNSLYDLWETLVISKKEWPAYCRRKGAKEMHSINSVT